MRSHFFGACRDPAMAYHPCSAEQRSACRHQRLAGVPPGAPGLRCAASGLRVYVPAVSGSIAAAWPWRKQAQDRPMPASIPPRRISRRTRPCSWHAPRRSATQAAGTRNCPPANSSLPAIRDSRSCCNHRAAPWPRRSTARSNCWCPPSNWNSCVHTASGIAPLPRRTTARRNRSRRHWWHTRQSAARTLQQAHLKSTS